MTRPLPTIVELDVLPTPDEDDEPVMLVEDPAALDDGAPDEPPPVCEQSPHGVPGIGQPHRTATRTIQRNVMGDSCISQPTALHRSVDGMAHMSTIWLY